MSDHLRSPAGRPIRVRRDSHAGIRSRWGQALNKVRRRAAGSVLLLLHMLSKL